MRRTASEILRNLEMRIARLERLTPNQKIMVYHSTTLESAVKMINGFDTLKIRTRQFNGPKHRGLFVSPMPLTQFGSVIFEIEVIAKFLHGTDYSGNIGRKNQDPHKDKFKNKDTYLENKYPDSFRPFLTESLNYESEPQALYLGLVKPSQIKRVQYNGQWMSREQFISISETNDYAKKLKLVDTQFDLSDPSKSIDEIYDYIDRIKGKGRKGFTRNVFLKNLDRMGSDRVQGLIEKTLNQLGFGFTAIRKYTMMIMRDLT